MIEGRLRSDRGFSLIEILSVTVIIGILALVASVSTIENQTRMVFANEKTAIRDAFWTARSIARNKNLCVRVQVEQSKLTAHSFSQADCAQPAGSLTLLFETTLKVSKLSPFSTGTVLVFNDGGGTIHKEQSIMDISTDEGESATLTVYPAIGQIRLTP